MFETIEKYLTELERNVIMFIEKMLPIDGQPDYMISYKDNRSQFADVGRLFLCFVAFTK